ncbi:putative HVA22-like protein g [Apium graveolens]|uniref:putative HVA22-like protein g n=1 Tax=Apium graveolens TaxID=4045 RepID=UPI003D7B201C
MIGSLLTRGLVMVLGYAYPAYECYKTVEQNKPDVEQLRFWCQYWILVAMLTVMERVGDTFVSWVPMYSEAKLFFYIYLWYPKTKGTSYVYDSFFRPYIAKHETDIDRNLIELRTRAGDYAVLYWQRAASYGQTRVLDILQYIALQSTLDPLLSHSQLLEVRRPPAAQNHQATVTAQTQVDEPASPATSTSSGEVQEEMVEEKDPPEVPASPTPVAAMNAQKSTATQSISGSSKPTTSNEEALAIETASSPAKEEAKNAPGQDAALEESIRVTRGRLRRTRVTSIR